MGVDGWSYQEVLPYFKKSEKYDGLLDKMNEKYHGRDGPLGVQGQTFVEPVLDVFLAAGIEFSFRSRILYDSPVFPTV